MYVRSQPSINAPIIPQRQKKRRRLSIGTVKTPKMTPHAGKFIFEGGSKSRVKTHRSSSVDTSRKPKYDSESVQLLHQGKLELSNGNYGQALKLLKQAPQSAESLYNQAVCYMHISQHHLALPLLQKAAGMAPLFDRQLYVALSMCQVAGNDIPSALREISKGLMRFPKFVEGYLIRGQLYNQQQRWDKAINDFKRVLKIKPEEAKAILGITESLEGLGDTKTAFKLLQRGIENPATQEMCLLKRARLFFRTKEFKKCISDLDNFCLNAKEDPDAYLLKGQAQLEEKDYTSAGLCFEQVLRINPNHEQAPNCICYLGAIKIREKDFYGAIHTFKRIPEEKHGSELKILKLYANGVIELIKRKFKNSISTFTKLIKSKSPVIADFVGQCYAFRAFGYTSTHEFKRALSDYKKAKKLNSLDQASLYNCTVTKALLFAGKQMFQESIKYLEKAFSIFPSNPDSLVFQVCILMSKPDYQDHLDKACALMDSAVHLRDEGELFYYRSIVKYLKGDFIYAISDLSLALEKSDDALYEQYVIRGLCKAALTDYREAIEDFSSALEIEERSLIYKYRAISAYLNDDLSLAFSDFQKYVSANAELYASHLQAGNLLVASGSYEEAVKAFKCANEIQETQEGLESLAGCLITLGNLSEAKQVLEKMQTEAAKTDLEILNVIVNVVQTKEFSKHIRSLQKYLLKPGGIFDEKYIRWMIGGLLILSSRLEEALEEFQLVLGLIHNKDSDHLSSDEVLITEEENCEILYNIALCYLEDNKPQSVYIMKDLAQVLNNSHKSQVLFLCGVLTKEIGFADKGQEMMEEGIRNEPYLEEYKKGGFVNVLPLNTGNNFSESFPFIDLDCKVRVRPAISLPRVKVQPFKIHIEDEVREFMAIDRINPQPEAPWLNRVKGCIQFTDSVIEVESETETEVEPLPKYSESEEEEFTPRKRPQSAVYINRFAD